MKKIAAIDIDGTIYPDNLGQCLFEELVSRGLCRQQSWNHFIALISRYRQRTMSREELSERASEVYALGIKGLSPSDITAVAMDIWARKHGHLFTFTRPLIELLHEHGYISVLISSSPEEIVRLVAKTLRVEGYCASQFGLVQGRYSGTVVCMPALPGKKRQLLSEFIHTRLGRGSVDLSTSIAIGNTSGDASMLSMVGRPLVFEPDHSLLSSTEARQWPVVNRENILFHVRSLLNS